MLRWRTPEFRIALLLGNWPPWLRSHQRASRIVAVALSAPPWVDRDALNKIYSHARALTKLTGVKHVVDHIVPVCHPMVCGLTVPWNLQVMTDKQNQAKGNSFHPDQLELPWAK
jgi:hypothetical protein